MERNPGIAPVPEILKISHIPHIWRYGGFWLRYLAAKYYIYNNIILYTIQICILDTEFYNEFILEYRHQGDGQRHILNRFSHL